MSKDTLDKTVAYLAKREGIDKTLKIIRYTSKILVASLPEGSIARQKFAALDSSIGTSRKAYRLGKFLQSVNALRRLNLDKPVALLELVQCFGEGGYYFLEQFTWLAKAGALDKSYEKRLAYWSALFELLGYAGSISVNVAKMRELQALWQHMAAHAAKEGSSLEATRELSKVRYLWRLRCALVLQDLADALTAVQEVTGGRPRALTSPLLIGCLGLCSGAISSFKNWYA